MPAIVHVLGIRHHGPGSARSVLRALQELQPARVVIEGPPELDAIAPLAASLAMEPPVAALTYMPDEPRRAAFYPMAAFSPEWVALRWALHAGVPVRFADLPAANALAPASEPAADPNDPGPEGPGEGDGDSPEAADRIDPIAQLAAAAGYDDPERWWEDAVEQRQSDQPAVDRFAAVTAAMREVRGDREQRPDTLRREAAMRKILRQEIKADTGTVAVICGAHHAPVLEPATFPSAAADNALLAGLPKVKVAATWVPWTSGRLAVASGYGAGVTSPGWYAHLFTSPSDPIARWMVRVAGELRIEQLDASPASAVEATRLATALAALRGRPLAGLTEVDDAARAVLCGGSEVPLRIIHQRLVIGHELGAVPDETPMVPLAKDLERTQRSLRLKVSAAQTTVQLDLRQPAQLARSVLFHRLLALGIAWATPIDAGRTTGTFKEAWQLEWRPELAVDLIVASVHGTTVEAAAASSLVARARATTDLHELATLVEQCLLAEVPDALDLVLQELAAGTARGGDARSLLEVIEPMARTCRYGDVRGVPTDLMTKVLETAATRGAIGLPTICTDLDDDAAVQVRTAIEAADRGLALVALPHLHEPWIRALASVATRATVHGAVAGRINRLLVDRGTLSVDEAAQRLARQLSVGGDPTHAAAWLDGFLAGEALLLLHDPQLLAIIDGWVQTIDDATFDDLLPLVRRTFSQFHAAERRQIGEVVARGPVADRTTIQVQADLDVARAQPAVATMARLLALSEAPA